MKGIIDRFEGDIAVIEKEDREFIHLNRSFISFEAKEGDEIDLETYAIKKKKGDSKRLEQLFKRKR